MAIFSSFFIFLLADFRPAITLYEAGKYEASNSAYALLEFPEGKEWQEEIRDYDRALNFIEEERFVPAIDLLERIRLGEKNPPWLQFITHLALAKALGLQAIETLNSKQHDEIGVIAPQLLVNHAREELEEAGKLFSNSQEATTVIREQQQWLLHIGIAISYERRKRLNNPKNIQELNGLLLSGVLDWQESLDLLSKATLLPSDEKLYLKNLQDKAKALQQFFDTLKLIKEVDTIFFRKIDETYQQFLYALGEGDLQKAQDLLSKLINSLKQLDTIHQHQPIEDRINYIVWQYDLLMESDTIVIGELHWILKQQQELSKRIDANSGAAIPIKEAISSIENAIDNVESDSSTLAILNLAIGRQALIAARENLIQRKAGVAESIKSALQKMRYAYQLGWLTYASGKASDSTIRSPLKKLHEMALKPLDQFQEILKKEEEREFDKGHCQKWPWEKVLPEFYTGMQSALMALQIIEHPNLPLTKTLEEQDITIRAWQKALALMAAPPPPGSDSCYGSTSKDKQSQQEKDSGAGKTSTADVLRSLQQMGQDDKIEKNKGVFKTEGDPW